MYSGDLDDVVAFLAQRLRNGPAAVRREVQDNYPQAKVLHFSDDLCDVLVSAGDEGVGDRAALAERHDGAAYLVLYPLAPAQPRAHDPELETGHLGQCDMICVEHALGCFVP